MATKEQIVHIARTYLRDFPKFFQVSFTPALRTYDLGKPNVTGDTLWVALVTGPSVTVLPSTAYALDERNGLLRLYGMPSGDTLMIEGYYHEWLSDEDLDFYSDMAIGLTTHNLGLSLNAVAPAVANVIGMYSIVQALWGLLAEYSRDIDVITSEAVHIIASQRYRMVASLLDSWTATYTKAATALNIGLDRIEVLNLRRVSMTTNRLVPLYKEREVGDYAPIERLWPGVPSGVIDLEAPGEAEEMRQDVLIEGEPAPGMLNTGFY
jgi:hypothetical protein